MTINRDLSLVKELPTGLPQSRGIWATTIGAVLTCLVLYYFFGALLTSLLFGSYILCVLYYAQDVLLYHPDLPANSRICIPIPSLHNLPHETVNICTPDKVKLHAFWIGQVEHSKQVPTLVYFHGNAGNMGHRMQNVWGIYYHLHCNILMVEYRGYGLSTGTPSEMGLTTDARAAVDYLYTRQDLDHSQIVLFGRSLGGAVTIDVAADPIYSKKIMCAIVENTFTSIPDMAIQLVHPFMKYVPSIFYKNKYQSLRKIQTLKSVPILFISGLADNLVPPWMMRTLFRECSSCNKQILEFIGGSHNDTWIVDGYYQGIQTFLHKCKHIVPPLQAPPEKSNMWHQIHDV